MKPKRLHCNLGDDIWGKKKYVAYPTSLKKPGYTLKTVIAVIPQNYPETNKNKQQHE